MRHAKSAWGEPGLDDFERPLLEKGKKRTRTIIEYLKKKNVKPGLLLSSPAVRALQTAQIMLHGLGMDKEALRIEKTMYTSDSEQLEDLFFDLPSTVDEILMVGHNPAVTNFVNRFIDAKIDALPTSGTVALVFDINDWEEVLNVKPKLRFVAFPKMLG
jgi:phosphohistidine phosphatase